MAKISDAAKVARKADFLQDYAVDEVQNHRARTLTEAATLCHPCAKRVKAGKRPLDACPECVDIRANGKPKREKARPKRLGRKERASAWAKFSRYLSDIHAFIQDAPKLFDLTDHTATKEMLTAFSVFEAAAVAWEGGIRNA
jgi:hypothetical protein